VAEVRKTKAGFV